MPKRKRSEIRRQLADKSSNSHDDVVLPMPTSTAKQYMYFSDESECSETKDQLRAGATVVAFSNGVVTPLTREESSEQYWTEETEELLPAPGNTATTTNPRILVPDCRDGPAYPRSLYEGWTPPLEKSREFQALAGLTKAYWATYPDDKPEYTYFTLDNFSIYRPANAAHHANELAPLDRLSKDRYAEYCFDGVLSFGTERYFLQRIPFTTLTIDGYGDSLITDMHGQLCIQSPIAKRQDVWYKLGTPAPEYKRFYQPFLWLVRFTKHFMEYLLCTQDVTIAHFRESFYAWLQATYGQDEQDDTLCAWLKKANIRDFRTTVAAHVEFLWKECYGAQEPSDEIDICEQPIWNEIHPTRLTAIPEKPNYAKHTIVTPFAFECFKTMYFADQFLETPITDVEVRQTVQSLKAKLGLTPLYEPLSVAVLTPLSDTPTVLDSALASDTMAKASVEISEIAVGDVVMLPPEHDGHWNSTAECWYAYVQRIRTNKDGRTRLDVIWLYHASDTTIGTAYYPFHNELFFSDNCGCDTRDHQEAIYLEEVLKKADVTWYACDPYQENEKGLFVRQKFRTVPAMDHYDFVTLQGTDFRCHHQPDHVEEEDEAYGIGDVVLVRSSGEGLGEIAQIVGGQRGHLHLRRLRRKREFDPSARANELLPTTEIFEATYDKEDGESCQIVRRCHVRVFSREDIDIGNLPTPYDRDGAGDFFFLEANTPTDAGADEIFPPLNQGWDPRQSPNAQKLTGLGIFCGGGTFDRGLEEGGAVKFRYAVDWAKHALHSYRANLKDPAEVQFFLGSVNDYLAKAMSGDAAGVVAQPGSVQVISAGSPCQAFSRLQLFTASEESKQNASMVASVVSFADIYCPKYMILENVVTMTESRNERKGHNVFSQILGALVGLGYQVQQFLVDSWSHGSAQQRSRLFIIATAPGLTPPPQPPCSHAHPPNMKVRSLGRSSNGLPFSTRKANPDVALPHISAYEAIGDLPPVYDSQPQLCPAFPDHRTATDESARNRVRMRAVPTFPRGMTLVQARDQGLLSGEPLHFSSNCGPIRKATTSRMFSRVVPHKLFPTFVTKLAVCDGIIGQCMHWDQHRVLTVMEAKRGQGYLDHEVLVGSAAQQMKIVGNSVDRKSALVLGLSLRESWLKSDRARCTDVEGQSPEVDMLRSAEGDMLRDEEDVTRIEGIDVDNRTVKMSLALSREDVEGGNQVTATTTGRRTFKEIIGILAEREKHRAAERAGGLRGEMVEERDAGREFESW